MFNNKSDFKAEFEKRLIERYGRNVKDADITERYTILGEMVRDYAGKDWRNCREDILQNGKRQCIYFSMEFLIGRLLLNNMQNLGIYAVAKDGLADYGIDINELEDKEPDAGLGNGGLGRLAACFLDSAASCGYPLHGNTIRYEYGFFRQQLSKGKQVELPDQWLSDGFVFEVRKPKHAVEVKFYGNSETYLKPNGEYAMRLVNYRAVRAVPYDVSVVGHSNGVANTLRLWSAEPSNKKLPTDCTFNEYLSTLKELSFGLYPDDSTEAGKMLRLKQQYFFVSCAVQDIIRRYLEKSNDFKGMPDKVCIQLNDTHPSLAIPEMMRLLMDVHGQEWDDAWDITTKIFAYTNHTIMAEALEKQLLNPNYRLDPFEDRLTEIINAEWSQREDKKFNRLLKQATLKYPSADLDQSIYEPERRLNTHVIERLSTCSWIDEPNNLLMTGGAGAGAAGGGDHPPALRPRRHRAPYPAGGRRAVRHQPKLCIAHREKALEKLRRAMSD